MASVILLFGFLGYTYTQTTNFHSDFQQINYSYQIINEIKETVQTVYVCESNVRGYALTQQTDFIKNYDFLQDSVQRQIRSLEKLTVNTRYQHQIHQFRRMIEERFRLLDTVITLANSQHSFVNKPEQLSLVYRGRELMAQIHNVEVRIQNSEEKLLNPGRRRAQASIRKTFIITGCAALAGLLISLQIGLIVHQYMGKQRELNENLLEINEQKNRFFSIIGHDLRGPIHSANTLLNIIRNQDEALSPADRMRFMDGAIETISQSTKLLDNLLLWGRSQLNHLSFNPEPVSVRQMADEILTLLAPIAEQKEITLTNEVPEQVYVHADAPMLGMVLRNLVSNAIKFTLPGGQVCIKSVKKAQSTEIQVCDTGIGIPDDVLTQLFQINTKYTSAGTHGERGTGLGLILCQEYIRKHKGTIEVQSILGKGSQFNIKLPAAA